MVDEAYLEFSENPNILRSHEAVRETDRPVIGLRTFSKFYGLAGLRIGYAFCSAKTMDLFARLENIFAVSAIAEEAAVAALADEDHARDTLGLLRTEKAHIGNVLGNAGLCVLPSEAHYMLVQCPVVARDAERVWGAFAEAGIIIPHGVFLDRYMMLPVLRREDNDRHLEIILSLARST